MLLKIAKLFDEELAKLAWNARIDTNTERSNEILEYIYNVILDRVTHIPDKRLVDIISNAIKWAIKNPTEIKYNVYNKKNILEISPNIISFQSVIFLICNRIRESKLDANRITVDTQSEFNKTQSWITKLYQNIKRNTDEPLQIGPHMPSMDLSIMPLIDIEYKSSENSIGLQLVDIHLWICKRFLENKTLAEELTNFFKARITSSLHDEISLESISHRWEKWFSNLPTPSASELEKGREFQNLVEERRKPYIIK